MPPGGTVNRYIDLKVIRSEMARTGVRLKRRWGQNFLIERSLLDFIVSSGDVKEHDLVLEVGSGPGCLTSLLHAKGAEVICVEIDGALLEIAKHLLWQGQPDQARERLTWIHNDFLLGKNLIAPKVEDVVWKKLDAIPGRKLKVISNLPYCIATPALINILESRFPWEVMVVTVQEEVADRSTAVSGMPDYGQLSVLAAAMADLFRLKKISPGSFWPAPKISSRVVKITPRKVPVIKSEEFYRIFKMFTRAIFAHRRKTWVKSLKTAYNDKKLDVFFHQVDEAGFSMRARAQDFDLQEIVELVELYSRFVDTSLGGDRA